MFLDYLRHLIPLVKNGFTSYLNSNDAILKRVATSPDRLLPFRQMAPTVIKAYTVIYSNKERLRTRAGLFNVLMFRGVFYGSVTQDLAIIRIQLLSTVILSAFYSFREHWN